MSVFITTTVFLFTQKRKKKSILERPCGFSWISIASWGKRRKKGDLKRFTPVTPQLQS